MKPEDRQRVACLTNVARDALNLREHVGHAHEAGFTDSDGEHAVEIGNTGVYIAAKAGGGQHHLFRVLQADRHPGKGGLVEVAEVITAEEAVTRALLLVVEEQIARAIERFLTDEEWHEAEARGDVS